MQRALITKADLKRITGIDVSDSNLPTYRKAFQHRSFSDTCNNERLEWIGDSVLSLVVSRFLYDTFPDVQEGVLTRYRVQLVSGKTLSRFSEGLGLEHFVQMDDKGIENEFFKSNKVLEDVFESLVGCVYLCEGFVPARNFVLQTIATCNININELLKKEENYKDQVMRLQQRFGCELPTYSLVDSDITYSDTGRKRTIFHMSCAVDVNNGDRIVGYGKAYTKKEAEQTAAHQVIVNSQLF
jgi:ribonuclease-3